MRARFNGRWALAASVLLHVASLGAGGWLVARSLEASPAPLVKDAVLQVELAPTEVELPSVWGDDVAGSPKTDEVLPESPAEGGGGGERVARPDMRRAGRGGTSEVNEAALNLADSNDGITLNRDPLNRLDQRSQVQRLRTARERRSWDDRRATPQPGELSFLASGDQGRQYRRPPALSDPSAGLARLQRASTQGGSAGLPAGEDTSADAALGSARVGGERRRSGTGVADGRPGRDYRESARVAYARPWVPAGRAAVPAPERGRPADTMDSSQDVASRVASLIHASTAGGTLGRGAGGVASTEPQPGSGGVSGGGSRSSANGVGFGPRRDDAPDPRLVTYFRDVQRRVRWDRAFPDWAINDGLGGVAIIGITVRPDGRLAKVHVVRASGVSEFDRNLVAAIERAAPFAPLPDMLGVAELSGHLRFDAVNPAVGREGPGPGRRY